MRIVWVGAVPLVAMGRIDLRLMNGAFWYDDVSRHAVVEQLVPLDSIAIDIDALGLIGAVHHMTRCGSTLIMRQISAVPGLFGVSEPIVFQQLLDGPAAEPALTRRRIRTMVALHRDALRGRADRFAIKWMATMAHHAAALAHALPEVPMLFLHRDPAAVMRSIIREPLGEPARGGSAKLAPSLRLAGLAPDVTIDDPVERLAHLVAGSCIAAAQTGGMVRLDYADLPDATPDAIFPYFGLSVSDADRAAVRDAARGHSKRPASPFLEPPTCPDDAKAEALSNRIVAPAVALLTERLSPLASRAAPR